MDELLGAGVTSMTGIASALNERGIPTARGGRWQAVQVQRLRYHLALGLCNYRHQADNHLICLGHVGGDECYPSLLEPEQEVRVTREPVEFCNHESRMVQPADS